MKKSYYWLIAVLLLSIFALIIGASTSNRDEQQAIQEKNIENFYNNLTRNRYNIDNTIDLKSLIAFTTCYEGYSDSEKVIEFLKSPQQQSLLKQFLAIDTNNYTNKNLSNEDILRGDYDFFQNTLLPSLTLLAKSNDWSSFTKYINSALLNAPNSYDNLSFRLQVITKELIILSKSVKIPPEVMAEITATTERLISRINYENSANLWLTANAFKINLELIKYFNHSGEYPENFTAENPQIIMDYKLVDGFFSYTISNAKQPNLTLTAIDIDLTPMITTWVDIEVELSEGVSSIEQPELQSLAMILNVTIRDYVSKNHQMPDKIIFIPTRFIVEVNESFKRYVNPEKKLNFDSEYIFEYIATANLYRYTISGKNHPEMTYSATLTPKFTPITLAKDSIEYNLAKHSLFYPFNIKNPHGLIIE